MENVDKYCYSDSWRSDSYLWSNQEKKQRHLIANKAKGIKSDNSTGTKRYSPILLSQNWKYEQFNRAP